MFAFWVPISQVVIWWGNRVQMYGEVFEGRFLEATERLYGEEGQRLLQEAEVPAYLQHVERRLNEEQERLLYYLDHSTKWVPLFFITKDRPPLGHCLLSLLKYRPSLCVTKLQ